MAITQKFDISFSMTIVTPDAEVSRVVPYFQKNVPLLLAAEDKKAQALGRRLKEGLDLYEAGEETAGLNILLDIVYRRAFRGDFYDDIKSAAANGTKARVSPLKIVTTNKVN